MADWTTCPGDVGTARDQWILDRVDEGDVYFDLVPIEVEAGGHTGTFQVFGDALLVGGVRVNVSATLAQLIADKLGCVMLTPRLADLIWANRTVNLPPYTRSTDGMSTTKAMLEQSAKLDQKIAEQGGRAVGTIVNTVGKHWVLVKSLAQKPNKAANYGWHFEGASFGGQKFEATVSLPGVRLIQGVGTVHDRYHADYSQICQLASRACLVDGEVRDLGDVMRAPELSVLVSHEGPLPFDRQPGVGETAAVDLPTGPGGRPPQGLPAATPPAKRSVGKTLAAAGAAGLLTWMAVEAFTGRL